MSSSPNDKDLPQPSEMQSLMSQLRDMERALEGTEEPTEGEIMPDLDAMPPANAVAESEGSVTTAPEEPADTAESPAFQTPVPPGVTEVETAPVAAPRRCPV